MNEPKPPRIGTVTSVYVTDGRVLVDIELPRPGTSLRKVPFHQLSPGLLITPSAGDRVIVTELDDRSPLASFPQGAPTEFSVPDLAEHELCFRLDDETELRFRKVGGTYEVTLGGSGDIRVVTSQNAEIDAQGDVDVTAGGSATISAGSDVAVTGGDVDVTASGTATVAGSRVNLGGSGGSGVARRGDSVRVWSPEHGRLRGKITGGSSVTDSQ
jgi:hypothetical protein